MIIYQVIDSEKRFTDSAQISVPYGLPYRCPGAQARLGDLPPGGCEAPQLILPGQARPSTRTPTCAFASSTMSPFSITALARSPRSTSRFRSDAWRPDRLPPPRQSSQVCNPGAAQPLWRLDPDYANRAGPMVEPCRLAAIDLAAKDLAAIDLAREDRARK
jgi:hypothetical protein